MVCGMPSNDNTSYIMYVVVTYWTVSISMVYLNKVLLSNEGLSVPAPLFVTWYQCFVTSVICYVAGMCGVRAQERAKNATYSKVEISEVGDGNIVAIPKPTFCAQFPEATYDMNVAKQVFPLSFVFVGMITFNNLCLKYVEVSFYNVARSLTIVFNVFFTKLILGIPSSNSTIICLLVVIAGFVVGAQGELNFSLIGTVSGILSSLFVSLNSIFTKKILPVVDDNHWRLTWYNNINATVMFLPLVYYFERHILVEFMDTLTSKIFWVGMNIAGFFGFAIGIVTVLQIKATSPLTHNISGTAKAAVQSIMAYVIWKNEPTFMGVLGIFTVLGGSLLYTYVKMNENNSTIVASPSSSAKNKDVEMQPLKS